MNRSEVAVAVATATISDEATSTVFRSRLLQLRIASDGNIPYAYTYICIFLFVIHSLTSASKHMQTYF